MQSLFWSDPLPLFDHVQAPRGPGLYVIGMAHDPELPILPCAEIDPYMRNWPNNLRGLYIGISESRGEGVRRRLRCHAKGRGNRDLARRIAGGESLWFLTASGLELAAYEALFLMMTNAFPSNIRAEGRRYVARLHRQIDREILSETRQGAPANDPDLG